MSGRLLGAKQPERSPTSSPIERKNSMNIPIISKENSRRNKSQLIYESSTTISPSGIWSAENNRSYSPTPTNSNDSTQPICNPTAFKTLQEPRNPPERQEEGEKSVIGSTTENVEVLTADIDTYAKNVDNLDMDNQLVPRRIEQTGRQPKYLRYNIWNPEGSLPTSTTEWTETALPLPRPPLNELSNQKAKDTIARNPLQADL
jgi:hypothetical protein